VLERRYLSIVRGERRGPLAAAARLFLSLLSLLFRLVVAARNAAYDAGLRRARRVEAPVISVGNLAAGGTGKTPFVEHLARALLARGRKVAVLSRGYRAAGRGAPSDEAALLAENLPAVAHVQDRDRVRGAREAIEVHGADCLLLDDGFQHRRLARDLDLVLIDALDPWGHGLLPRGLLREPASALARADGAVITRADLVPRGRLEEIAAGLRRARANLPIVEAAEEAQALVPLAAGPGGEPPGWLDGRAVFAFAGIGHPDAFYARLERLGARVCGRESFPDHYAYRAVDLARLRAAAREARAEALVCTQKDAVKLAPLAGAERGAAGALPVLVLKIRTAILAGEIALEQLLERALAAPRSHNALRHIP
jgi:tetraacyldisaccharide 4'-kinase